MKSNLIALPLAMLIAVALFLGAASAADGQSAEIIPLMQFSNVPLPAVIQNLCRQARINYLIDPMLFGLPNDAHGNVVPAPTVTLIWTNLTAQDAVARLLKEHNLVMIQDQFTTVAFITSTNHAANVVDASLLDSTNLAVPMIFFEDVPLDQGLKQLVDQNHLNVVLDPKVSDYVDSTDPMAVKFHSPPTVSLRWENLTAKQAIVALCENYDLVIIKDPVTGAVRIKPKN
jgi:hypothetical protein